MTDTMMAAINAAAAPTPVDATEGIESGGAEPKRAGSADLPENGDESSSSHKPDTDGKGKPKLRVGSRELDLSPDELSELAKQLKWKVKIDGKVDEVDIDKLVRRYQIAEAAEKRLQEANQYKQHLKTYTQLVDQLKEDPGKLWDLAKTLGHDPYKLAEDHLFQKFQYDSMSEEQRELHELKGELQQLKAMREQQLREQEEQQRSAVEQHALEELDQELSKLFDETGGKMTRADVELVVNLLRNSYESGQEMSVRDAHHHVQALKRQIFNETLGNLSDEELSQLPPGFLERLRARDVASAQAKVDPFRRKRTNQTQDAKIPDRKPTEKNRPTIDEFFKNLGV